jgi:hypothetical protein
MSNRITQSAQPVPAPTYQQPADGADLSQSGLQLMSAEEFCQLGVPDLGYIRHATMFGYASRFIIFGADGVPVVQTKDLHEVMEFALQNQMMLLPLH